MDLSKKKSNIESVIGSFYTLSACIDKVPNVVKWNYRNIEQEKYLKIYENCKGAKIPEIESKVSIGTVEPVNKFLKDKGFDIQLDQLKTPEDLAIASVLELLLKWIDVGIKGKIHYNNSEYTGVHLESGVNVMDVGIGYGISTIGPVGIINTRNKDKVLMTIPSKKPNTSFEVLDMARSLILCEKRPSEYYESYNLSFPMIDLDIKPDINWLVDMWTWRTDNPDKGWNIDQALQQTKVKLNEEGCEIKEAVAIGVRCFCASFDMKHPFVIDKPFLLVVQREGLKEPLFSAYLDIDSWIKE